MKASKGSRKATTTTPRVLINPGAFSSYNSSADIKQEKCYITPHKLLSASIGKDSKTSSLTTKKSPKEKNDEEMDVSTLQDSLIKSAEKSSPPKSPNKNRSNSPQKSIKENSDSSPGIRKSSKDGLLTLAVSNREIDGREDRDTIEKLELDLIEKQALLEHKKYEVQNCKVAYEKVLQEKRKKIERNELAKDLLIQAVKDVTEKLEQIQQKADRRKVMQL